MERLRRSPDFARVKAEGTRVRGRLLMLTYAPAAVSRCGFAVSKAVGNAVARNRVKRWLREATRVVDPPVPADLVFAARAGAAEASFFAIRDEALRLLGAVR